MRTRQEQKRLDNRLMQLVTANSDIDEIVTVLDNGANINHTGYRGLTPLMMRVYIRFNQKTMDLDKRSHVIATLLERGANINDVNNAGNTAAMIAILYGVDIGILDMLLMAGADVSIRNNEGFNIMELCTRSNVRVTPPCLNLLRAHEVRREYLNRNGYPATMNVFLRETPLTKDVLGIIFYLRDLEFFCSNNDPKYIGGLWAIAEIIGLANEVDYKSMDKVIDALQYEKMWEELKTGVIWCSTKVENSVKDTINKLEEKYLSKGGKSNG